MSEGSVVILCLCQHTELVPAQVLDSVRTGLQAQGIPVHEVADLCGLAARRDPVLRTWAEHQSLSVLACYPRAVRWLFHAGGAPLEGADVRLFNLRTESPAAIVAAIDTPAQVPEGEPNDPDDWIPWFPVIDRDRCRNCKLCLNFCLFGVYGLDSAERVTVKNPDHCKTNCPACARVCPVQAIVFPKHPDSPINGDEVSELTGEGTDPPSEVQALLQGDIHALLRERSAARGRFSTNPQSDLLRDLHRKLGIPLDVLHALSPADLARIRQRTDPRATDEGDVHA